MAVPPAQESGYLLWWYYPSVSGNIIFLVLFGILSVMHLVGLFARRMMFCLPLLIGGIFEVIGYGVRAYAHSHTNEVAIYAAQATLILLAPILFAASVYMYLGRLMIATNTTELSPIPTKYLTKIFVCGDVLCFLIQAGGSGILSTAKIQNGTQIGEDIILAGLCLQIIFTALFLVVVGLVHKKMANARQLRESPIAWQRLLVVLYIVCGLISLRNIYRAIEYGLGSDGYLLTREWPAWIFDGVLMVLAVSACVAWYIGEGAKLNPYSGYANVSELKLTRSRSLSV